MSFRYKLTGIQETIARLQQFDTKFRRSVLRRAGNEGSRIALAALKSTAPKQTGTWRKSLGRKVQVKNGGLTLWYGAGPRSSYYAMVTFNPGKNKANVQRMERRRNEGRVEIRERGKARDVRVGDVGGSVRILKNSKRGANGQPALFWRDKSGKVRAMPLKRKYWPVLYSHLIEKGTKTGGKAHHMIARAQAQSLKLQEAAIVKILQEAVASV